MLLSGLAGAVLVSQFGERWVFSGFFAGFAVGALIAWRERRYFRRLNEGGDSR